MASILGGISNFFRRYFRGSASKDDDSEEPSLPDGIEFGACGYFSMQRHELSPDVLDYIKSDELFNITEEELKEEPLTMQHAVDYPHIPNHIYYEGYFHSYKDLKTPFLSTSSRYLREISKPPVQEHLRRFILAFKAKNKHLFEEMIKRLPDGNVFKELFINENFFSDCSVQFHYGDEVDEENLGWHIDAPNSVLHMAISVHGSREMHYQTVDSKGRNETLKKVSEKPGSVYISSPWNFKHAVRYFPCGWNDRIIAVQVRTIHTKDEYQKLSMNLFGPGVQIQTSRIIAEFLNDNPFQMPTLEDINNL